MVLVINTLSHLKGWNQMINTKYNYPGKLTNIYTYIYIYIYIYCHPQTDCFVLSDLFSVARPAGRSKPGSKPVQFYDWLRFQATRLQADFPGRVIPKTLKMELDTTLLDTQHYKVRFKGKVEQSREWSSALPYTLV